MSVLSFQKFSIFLFSAKQRSIFSLGLQFSYAASVSCECILLKASCTLLRKSVSPILLWYGCHFANDSARWLTNSISTLGGIGGSNGSTCASMIVGLFSPKAWRMIAFTSPGSLIEYPLPPQLPANLQSQLAKIRLRTQGSQGRPSAPTLSSQASCS
jgi:hypothetical protein